ncbi:hypothetical protein ACHAWF_015537 [Thalassiosira exigua]
MAGLGRRSHYRKHLTDAVLHDLPEPDESLGQRIARVVGTRGGNMFDVVVAPSSNSNKGSADAEEVADHDAHRLHEEGETSSKSAIANGGVNQVQSSGTSSTPVQTIHRAPQLAFLPTKFRKLVWIKRNDFVIVQCGEEESEGAEGQKSDQRDSSSGGGFRYVITHILYKDQVKHIKSKGLWPLDPFFAEEGHIPGEGSKDEGQRKSYVGDGAGADHSESQPGDGSDRDPRQSGDAYEDNGIVFDDPLDDEYMVNTNRLATLRVEDSSSEEDSDDD